MKKLDLVTSFFAQHFANHKITIERLPHSNYIPCLDGLRCVCVLAVIIYHCIRTYLVGGWVGVDVFFALSGFLITSTLMREWQNSGTISLSKFYLRRMVRLMPALYVMLTSIVVVLFVSGAGEDQYKMVLVSSVNLMNWSRALHWGFDGYLGHTWSLAIEEQFYLFWPPLCLLILMIGDRKWLKIMALAVAMICLCVRLAIFNGENFERIYNGFDTRADSLIFGCFFACLGSKIILPRFCYQNFLPASFLCLVGFYVNHQDVWLYTWGWSVIAFASAWLVYSLATGPETHLSRILQFTPMVYLGRISYGVYLWHYPILFFLKSHLDSNRIVTMACLFFTIVVASLSYVYVEQPLIKLWRSRPPKVRHS
jgi:peptidoglycan/LPS O-acetylase OafA/YrhL